ncbi:hypothetical protein ACJMK2_003907 [Sinanodonta woodiana]|uniref:Uncharacterized protein n=1 Tax=Sinanodonta woodiana TaxID=1069815 RepID=A0ABD3Y2H5_SINWO
MVLTAASLAVTMGENCRDVRDCEHETCTGGGSVSCIIPPGGTGHVCTCVSTSNGKADDCRTGGCDGGRDEHCIDGHCRCFH